MSSITEITSVDSDTLNFKEAYMNSLKALSKFDINDIQIDNTELKFELSSMCINYNDKQISELVAATKNYLNNPENINSMIHTLSNTTDMSSLSEFYNKMMKNDDFDTFVNNNNNNMNILQDTLPDTPHNFGTDVLYAHEDCNICSETLLSDDEYKLKCNHKFHYDCIKMTFVYSGNYTCPYCRQYHGKLYDQCTAILKSGKNKGTKCILQAKFGKLCGRHKVKTKK